MCEDDKDCPMSHSLELIPDTPCLTLKLGLLGQSSVNPPWLPEGIREKIPIERYRVQELSLSADHGETGVPFNQLAQWGH